MTIVDFVEKLRKGIMTLSLKQFHIYPTNRHPQKTIENINIQLQNTNQLDRLETKLNDFDAELAYTNIYTRLTEEYNKAKMQYKSIEKMQKEKHDSGKEVLVQELDLIVNSLRRHFLIYTEEKYILLDEIFLVRTNSHVKCDLDKLAIIVDEVLEKPRKVVEEELEKMERIRWILDKEENRLKGIE